MISSCICECRNFAREISNIMSSQIKISMSVMFGICTYAFLELFFTSNSFLLYDNFLSFNIEKNNRISSEAKWYAQW